MKVLVVSEGNADVREPSESDGRRGVVRVLVTRLLENRLGRRFATLEVEVDRLSRFHEGTGYARKVKLAVVEAGVRGCDALVIVVDADRTKDRMRSLREGRQAAQVEGPVAERTALGVAIETVEAWLLADEQALSKVLGDTVQTLKAPESYSGGPGEDDHPKSVLVGLARQAKREPRHVMDEVAKHLDLACLRKRCDRGFEPFAKEVEQLCLEGET